MPAKSEKQAIAARIARGIQKGEVKPKAGTASAQMAKMPAKSLKHFTKTESKCPSCGGDGWYVEPDEKGEPQQVQCSACQGQGGHKDPEPRTRPSGEPENEPFFESTKPIKLGNILKEMYDWRDDPAMSRRWEKSDVSQDEFERHMGFAKQRPVQMAFKGITFFNVSPNQEQLAYEVGLRKLKSGKWGHKHPQTDTTADKEILKRAEQEFGQGRYWEPKK